MMQPSAFEPSLSGVGGHVASDTHKGQTLSDNEKW